MKTRNVWMLLLSTGLIIGMLTSAASADDWSSFQSNNYNNGVVSAQMPTSFDDNWTYTVTGGGWIGFDTAPVIGNNIAYELMSNGDIYAIYTSNGSEAWVNDDIGGNGNFEICTPAYDSTNDVLFVGLSSGNTSTGSGIYALDGSTGDLIWSNDTAINDSYQLDSPIKFDGDYIYFGSVYMTATYPYEGIDGTFYCVDADTGVVVWSDTIDGGFYYAAPAIIGDYVVVGDENGIVHSYNKATGAEVDTFDTTTAASGASNPLLIRSGIVYYGGNIYYTATALSASEGYLVSVDFSNGYFGTNYAASGNIGARITTTPAVTSSNVYIGADDYNVTVYDTSLSSIAKIALDGAVKSSPVVSTYAEDDLIYVTTNTGTGHLYCLTFDNEGRPPSFSIVSQWTESSGYTLQGIAFSNGVLVYGNDNKDILGASL